MKVVINGMDKMIPNDVTTIQQLLEHLKIGEKKAVVERNGNILTKDEHKNEAIEEGDRIEIVHFVGGG